VPVFVSVNCTCQLCRCGGLRSTTAATSATGKQFHLLSSVSRASFWFLSVERCHSAFYNAVPEKRKHFHRVTRLWKGGDIVVVFTSSAAEALDTASELELSLLRLEESEEISPSRARVKLANSS